MRQVFINTGDNHAGLSTGLIPPKTVLLWAQDDEREVLLSGWSDWLWHEVWLPGLSKVEEIAGSDPVYLLHSGDIVHGSRFVENLYTPFITHQVQIALGSYRPARQLPTFAGFALVSGTGSHDYGGNSASHQVRNNLIAWGYPVWYDDHILANFEGYRVDLAHHGSYVSKMDHLKENSLRRDVKQLMGHDLEWGRSSANLYQRGHVHNPISTVVEKVWKNETRIAQGIITPPMTGPNGYARQATNSMQEVTCGFYITIVEDDRTTVIPWLHNRDTRQHHVIKFDPKRLGPKEETQVAIYPEETHLEDPIDLTENEKDEIRESIFTALLARAMAKGKKKK